MNPPYYIIVYALVIDSHETYYHRVFKPESLDSMWKWLESLNQSHQIHTYIKNVVKVE